MIPVDHLHGVQEGRRWAALGKHLCGAATDFSLRCCFASGRGQASSIQEAGQYNAGAAATGRPGQQQGKGFQGLAIAPCCHHRCSWEVSNADRAATCLLTCLLSAPPCSQEWLLSGMAS